MIKGALQKNLGVRVVIIVLTICVLFCLQAKISYAGTAEKMYFKKAGFSSYYKGTQYSNILGVYGEGEGVAVYGRSRHKDKDGKIRTYYETRFFGEKTYIDGKFLTNIKSELSYTSSTYFKELIFDDGVMVYDSPCRNSSGREYQENAICTIGQTKNWYKVFVNGKTGFISKAEKAIIDVRAVEFPLKIKQPMEKEKNVRNRVRYQYAMLPQKVRKHCNLRRLQITITQKLPNDAFEEAGYSGYTTSRQKRPRIYLKETERPYLLEGSFFHEVGHVMTRLQPELLDGTGKSFFSCFSERRRLNLGEHYQTQTEYAAELFAIYMMKPDWLSIAAPRSYAYIDSICKK